MTQGTTTQTLGSNPDFASINQTLVWYDETHLGLCIDDFLSGEEIGEAGCARDPVESGNLLLRAERDFVTKVQVKYQNEIRLTVGVPIARDPQSDELEEG